ncbi:plasmid replication protein, CyRepA1 family [Spirulina sp.]|uniref:plasmid replication protein, CyRepA1 family n=1 Tax=Spirulina sp. TaxID=1157 RepID=UPI003F730635
MRQELKTSEIAPDIIARHFRTLGPEAWEYLFNGEFPNSERRNDGRLRNKWMRNYAHLDNGGWWCSGYDPLTGGDMDWGTFKPNTPRQVQDGDRTKTIKYEHPPKQRTRAFFLHTATYWERVKADPSIPIVITEGAKKAAAVQSQDIPAIGLPGIFSGYRSKDAHGNPIEPTLIPELEAFAQPGREFVFFFDQDAKPKTRRAVATAIANTGRLLIGKGCKVTVSTWDAAEGKGIDDVIASHGAERFHTLFAERTSWTLFKARQAVANPLGSYRPTLRANTHCLTTIAPDSIPSKGIVVLFSGLGTGKTKLIRELTKDVKAAIAPGHRVSLMASMAATLGFDYISDIDIGRWRVTDGDGNATRRIALCWDSLLGVPVWLYDDGSFDLVLDEVEQGFWHLFKGGTLKKDGKRPGVVARAIALIKGARRVIAASGTLTAADINLLCRLRGEQPFILQNDYQGNGYRCDFFTNAPGRGTKTQERAKAIAAIILRIDRDELGIVATDQKSTANVLEMMGLSLGLTPHEILKITAETSGSERVQEFLTAQDKAGWLREHGIRLLIHNSSMTSGVSIEGHYFDFVGGIFNGSPVPPADALQMLIRYRHPVPRIVFAAHRGQVDDIGKLTADDYQAATDRYRARFTQATGRHLPSDNEAIADWVATTSAARNRAMLNFGSYLQATLEAAGHTVVMGRDDVGAAEPTAGLWRDWGKAFEEADRQATVDSDRIDYRQAKTLRDKRYLTPEEARQLYRFDLCDDFVIDPEALTVDLIKLDNKGRYRHNVARLEALLWDGLALTKDNATFDKLSLWQEPIAAGDLPKHELQSKAAIALGIPEMLKACLEGDWHGGSATVKATGKAARACAEDVRLVLGFNPAKMTDMQIVGEILRRYGLKTRSRRGTIAGKRVWIYSVHEESLVFLRALLQRRAKRHIEQGFKPAATPLNTLLLVGVATSPPPPPDPTPPEPDPGVATPLNPTQTELVIA